MKHHPSNDTLMQYADGTIDACNGLIVAAHLERCPHCSDLTNELEAKLASDEIDVAPTTSAIEVDMAALLSQITDMTQAQPVEGKPATLATVEVNGKTFKLPAALKGIAGQLQDWKSYGGKVFSASFDIGEEERVSLLYISEDVQVPQHTHKGTEATLVLHGEFEDENGHYKKGDFMIEDGETKHTPRTMKGQDCLCLTVLTEPMVFTQGVARIFNMFGRGMYP
jgi:putative transcriptional regulator